MGLLDAFFGGKADDSAAREMKEEESRKAALRRRVDEFYGIDSPEDLPPGPQGGKGIHLMDMLNALRTPGVVDANVARTQHAATARGALEAENKTLGDSTRDFYTDSLNRSFGDAERRTRFALARKGLSGGSADSDANAELNTDRNLGATRISDAVGRSVNGLINQREQERLNAYALIGNGAGESAINAAASGLKRSFDTAQTAEKANLFGDLFSTGVTGAAASNASDQEALFNQRYRDRLNTFFAPPSSTSGRVTASG